MALGQQNLLQDSVLGVMAATFALLIVRGRRAHLRERKRRERRSRGCCAECGYDLRGGNDRCPECGTPARKRRA